MQPRLELSRQHQVHEHGAHHDRHQEAFDDAARFLGQAGGARRIARGQVLLVDDLFQRVGDGALTDAGSHVRGDGDLPLTGQAIDLRRASGARHGDYRGQRHAAAVTARHGHLGEPGQVVAVGFFGPRAYVVVLTQIFEGGHFESANQELQ